MREAVDFPTPHLYALLLKQDDPRKCTAARLCRLGLATPLYKVGRIPRGSLILNPLASRMLLPNDKILVERYGLVAIDCSWERAQNVFGTKLLRSGRRLPALLASNPVNYAKLHKLSSAEAIAAALYVLGFKDNARRMLASFKWGETFFTLNYEPLESYSEAETAEGMSQTEAQYF